MADEKREFPINPEVADHLAAAMDTPDMPGAEAPLAPLGGTGQRTWPDGYGKRRHPKERDAGHGRIGQGAAVTAIHRTSRPQMPHSS
ncbi:MULTISPECIES: hypothetical protein [Micrococcaceae]|jgi:hypothetical protein|uniref:hypothetical protein n=1 Tax=Micrococcaceae TaxID=1268 RepID=UPI0012F902E3|nr:MULTISPECIES: hypothetical protein [Pseudarthrobacter]MEA3552576.1 hypothetical protein [Pseudarthrobacter sp. C1]MUU71129.1 hypothetical protein [Pseudarthrobacter sp. GA104]WPU09845.1 hypothetical protein SMD14_02165 [Pseudarthrobacter oxydans]HET7783410.1 hypothetical protein [Arthrobacter sp.]